jgi:predicted  nucleic acid-binding Zn-ribbon protein
MKASVRQQRVLLEIQRLDTEQVRLLRRRAQLPERAQLAALASETTNVRDRFMSAQRELEDRNVEIARIEGDLEVVAQRRARNDARMAVTTASKEAQSLQDELVSLERRRLTLEEQELEVMEVVEQAQPAFDAAVNELAAIDRRRSELEQALSLGEEHLLGESAAAAAERELLAAELQRDLLMMYEETRDRYGLGAARLRGNISEGSNMALADAELAAIRATDPEEIVYCPVSGAILVRDYEE